ncbi:MAG: hypothetical protein H7A35_07090 [Planctomycetales bacterium]|nr:hypothetical protein [bacterium]UNM09817.1 MAG: hypothetical protein H7A35_07090 [Planctomycetales bacterium]
MVTQLRRLFAYEFEMTEKVIGAVERAGDCEHAKEARRQAAHIIAGRACWLERIDKGNSDHVDMWPDKLIRQIRDMDLATQLRLQIILSNMDDTYLRLRLRYRSHEGENCERSMHDILMHMVLHSAFHRGYVNTSLKACGRPAVNSDYIVWAD